VIPDFIKNNKVATGLVICLPLAFAAGKYTAKIDTKEVIKTVEVTKDKIVEVKVTEYVDRVVEKVVYVKRTNIDTKKETTTTKLPDGTVTVVVVETDKSKTETASSQETTKDTAVVVNEAKQTDTSKSLTLKSSKEVSSQEPQWKFTVNAQAGGILGTERKPLVGFGLSAERRILGPFWVGVVASVDLGIALTGVTGVHSVKGGLVFGVEL